MPAINKRITRSSTLLNSKNSSDMSITTSSAHDDIDEQVPVKRARTQRQSFIKKQLVNEPQINLLSDDAAANQPENELTYAIMEPVPLDLCDTIPNPPDSPPPLVIDTTEPMALSPFNIPNRTGEIQSNTTCNLSCTPLEPNRISNNLKNITQSISNKDAARINNNQQMSGNDNVTNASVTMRTPNIDRNTTDTSSQISNRCIVASVDCARRNSNQENIFNYRTSTPYLPRHQQNNVSTQESYDDSFSVDSIPIETKNILFKFAEFRRLVKEYKSEQRNCRTWMNDYARLKKRYDILEQNSFPRPSASALNYLVDLVTHIQQSNGNADKRNDEQLAKDFGISPLILKGLKATTPQQTALNLFNHFYPGYISKTKLKSVNNLETSKPGLLDIMLVVAQHSSPGVRYQLQDIRDTLNNSIRGARHHYKKKHGDITDAMTFLNRNSVDDDNCQTRENQDLIHSNMNEQYEGALFHHGET